MAKDAADSYASDTDELGKLPDDLRLAVDEIIILCYSTDRSPTRAARIAGYLALLVHGSRNDVQDFMRRRQIELAGGRVEPVAELVRGALGALERDDRLRETFTEVIPQKWRIPPSSPSGIRPHKDMTEDEARIAGADAQRALREIGEGKITGLRPEGPAVAEMREPTGETYDIRIEGNEI